MGGIRHPIACSCNLITHSSDPPGRLLGRFVYVLSKIKFEADFIDDVKLPFEITEVVVLVRENLVKDAA